jgi:Fur family ferric uptake transcriptional regulator
MKISQRFSAKKTEGSTSTKNKKLPAGKKDSQKERVRPDLKGKASRWTLPRQVIFDLLKRSPSHLSAKEIYDALHRAYPGIGLSTIYRTLELLFQLGLIRKLSSGDGQSRYELKTQDLEGHHHHLICLGCGRIIDYQDFAEEELQLIKKTEKVLAKKYNFLIKDHKIEFFGLCEKCR